MYKAVWTPTIGERLCVQREPRKAHDRRAVAVLTSEDTLVGHAPREISKIFWHFLSYGTITCEVTGPRKRGNGLEVPCEYKLLGTEKLVKKAKLLLLFQQTEVSHCFVIQTL